MVNLNKDVLFLILNELQNDKRSLHSCLLVNKNWCEMTVPILWKIPVRNYNTHKSFKTLFKLFKLLYLHLSDESKDILKNHGIDTFTEMYQKLLFNYISFWRYLNLCFFNEPLYDFIRLTNVEESKVSIVRNEILLLFINSKTKFTRLYIPTDFEYQLHLIPGAERCFSELEFLYCGIGDINQSLFLGGLSKISKSIKILKFHTSNYSDYSGMFKLIEAQKNLNHFCISIRGTRDDSLCKSVEESLIKHADTIQHLQLLHRPITNFLSYLVNLISLECSSYFDTNWKQLGNVSLPVLKILKAQNISHGILSNLIENTGGHLTEISIELALPNNVDSKRLVQTIHQNCPNLRYLRLYFNNDNISELKKLLINCQDLNGLFIHTDESEEINWNYLFDILIELSPPSLYKFKFKFHSSYPIDLEALISFFNHWIGRCPILLHTIQVNIGKDLDKYNNFVDEIETTVKEYKAKGIVKFYENELYGNSYDDFEWFQKTDYGSDFE